MMRAASHFPLNVTGYSYSDKHPQTLDDIRLAAEGAIADLHELRQKLLTAAADFGPIDGKFLVNAADALSAIIHDELAPEIRLSTDAMDSGTPQAGVVTYHREIARENRRAAE